MFKNGKQRKGYKSEIEAEKSAAEQAEAWTCFGRQAFQSRCRGTSTTSNTYMTRRYLTAEDPNTSPKRALCDLPAEILVNIFKHTSIVDHLILSLCSKQLWGSRRTSQALLFDHNVAHSTTRRIKSTWKSFSAWWPHCQLTKRSAGITGSMCDGQTSRTGNLFEGSSCGRVYHLRQYARTIVHAVLPSRVPKTRSG